jgi:hypothetical protein
MMETNREKTEINGGMELTNGGMIEINEIENEAILVCV